MQDDANEVEREIAVYQAEDAQRRKPFTPEQLDQLRSTLRDIEPDLRMAVRDLRENLGWSQAELARQLAEIGVKVDPTAITRIEVGKRKVSPEELWALAVVLRVEVDGLIIATTNVLSAAERLEFEEQRLANIEKSIRFREEERANQLAVVKDLRRQAKNEARDA